MFFFYLQINVFNIYVQNVEFRIKSRGGVDSDDHQLSSHLYELRVFVLCNDVVLV